MPTFRVHRNTQIIKQISAGLVGVKCYSGKCISVSIVLLPSTGIKTPGGREVVLNIGSFHSHLNMSWLGGLVLSRLLCKKYIL